jgi:hypothetical protein
MVENIKEIEPVIKKETTPVKTETAEDETPAAVIHTDPAQMKLEL